MGQQIFSWCITVLLRLGLDRRGKSAHVHQTHGVFMLLLNKIISMYYNTLMAPFDLLILYLNDFL